MNRRPPPLLQDPREADSEHEDVGRAVGASLPRARLEAGRSLLNEATAQHELAEGTVRYGQTFRYSPDDSVTEPLQAAAGHELEVVRGIALALPATGLRFLDQSEIVLLRDAAGRSVALLGYDNAGTCSYVDVDGAADSIVLHDPVSRSHRGLIAGTAEAPTIDGRQVDALAIYSLREIVTHDKGSLGRRAIHLDVSNEDIERFVVDRFEARDHPAHLLLQTAKVGPDEVVLSRLTGIAPAQVRMMLRRLADNGILKRAEIRGEWERRVAGHPYCVGLILDAMVAAGTLVHDPATGAYRLRARK